MESVNDFYIDYRAPCVMQLNGCVETKVITPWDKKISTYKCEIGRATSGDTSCKSADVTAAESLQQLKIPIPSYEFSLKLEETKCLRKSWIHSKSHADRGSTFTELLHKERTQLHSWCAGLLIYGWVPRTRGSERWSAAEAATGNLFNSQVCRLVHRPHPPLHPLVLTGFMQTAVKPRCQRNN